MGEGSQNVQTSRYNINKSWDIMYTIHHGDRRFIFFKISLQFNWHVTLVSSGQPTDLIFVCMSNAPSPPTWWTWVWVSSGSWWWTVKPVFCMQSMGSQSQTRLSNWTELKLYWSYCGDGCTTTWMYLIPLNYIPKNS